MPPGARPTERTVGPTEPRMCAAERRTGRPIAALLALLGLFCSPPGATAQDANEEDERGWRGSAELGVTFTEGNSETTNLSLGSEAIHRRERTRWTFSAGLLRATADGEETANRGHLSAQHDFFPVSRWFVFARARAEYNRPAAVLRRLTLGLGTGYVFVETERVRLSGELGSDLISERFPGDSTSEAFFGSFGERFELTVSETSRILQSLTVQPKFEDPGNFLGRGEATLTARVIGALGLRVGMVGEYDSSPFVDEEGIRREKLDLTFRTGLAYEF